ncbi:MAG TPA: sulfatase-like hydrolase/transferase, partial [Spirochaetota bacterium]
MKKYFRILIRESAPGAIAAVFSILYTLLFNTSLSYMGNSVDNALNLILNKFLGVLLIVIGKLILAYVLIYGILGFFFFHAIRGLMEWRGVTLRRRYTTIIASVSVILFTIVTLFRDLVLYPQMYIDSFYLKNPVYRFIQETLTNNVNPAWIGGIQIVILVFFGSGFIYRFRSSLSSVINLAEKNKRVTAGLVTAGIVSAVVCNVSPFTAETDKRKNVLILASDALRPDHMSGYGYRKKTTPTIDTLIAQGSSYTSVFTMVPRTFPSWVSILSSSYPYNHTIRNMFPSSATRNRELVTLPSILRNEGYHTAVVGDFAADIFPRIDLGFETVKAPTFDAEVLMEQILLKTHTLILPYLTNRPGISIFSSIREFAEFADPRHVTNDMKGEIDRARKEKRPFFITSFYSITHFPFSGPYPYYNEFTDRSVSGPSKYLKNRIVSLKADGKANYDVGEKEIDHIRSLYDGCLHGFDDSVAEMIGY